MSYGVALIFFIFVFLRLPSIIRVKLGSVHVAYWNHFCSIFHIFQISPHSWNFLYKHCWRQIIWRKKWLGKITWWMGKARLGKKRFRERTDGGRGTVVVIAPKIQSASCPIPHLNLTYHPQDQLLQVVFADTATLHFSLDNCPLEDTCMPSVCKSRKGTLDGIHCAASDYVSSQPPLYQLVAIC